MPKKTHAAPEKHDDVPTLRTTRLPAPDNAEQSFLALANTAGMPTSRQMLGLQQTIGNRAVTRRLAHQRAGQVQRTISQGSMIRFKSMTVLRQGYWIQPGTYALVTKAPDKGQLDVQIMSGTYAGTTADIAERYVDEVPDNPALETMSLATLVPLITAQNISQWSDHDLMTILRGPFASNWFNLRNSLTLDQWPSSIKTFPARDLSLLLMDRMVSMRDRKWNAFKNALIPRIKAEVAAVAAKQIDPTVRAALTSESQDSNSPKDHLVTFDPLGSQAVTSDIDLSMGGKNTEIAVAFINREFRANFGVAYDPGTVFDINVYASDWIHGDTLVSEVKGARVVKPNAEVPMSPVAPLGPQSTAIEQEPGAPQAALSKPMLDPSRRDDQGEIWSLVKVRRNMAASEWAVYKTKSLSGLAGDEKQAMEGKYSRVEYEYKIFLGKIKLRMDQLAEGDDLLDATAKTSAFGTDRAKEGLETRASNDIYAEILLRVKRLRLEIARAKADLELTSTNKALKDNLNRLAIALGYAIAESLTYANEVYASEGAVQHTVLAQGASGKMEKLNAKGAKLKSLTYALTPEAYLQAVNENVGDSLHSLHAYEKQPPYAVYRAGKYVGRLIDATNNLLGDGDPLKGAVRAAASAPHYNTLKLLGDNAKRAKAVKTPVQGKKLEGVPDTVLQDVSFKGQTEHSIETLREELVIFGAAVALLSKQPVPEPESGPPSDDVAPLGPASSPSPSVTPPSKRATVLADELPPQISLPLAELNKVFDGEKDKEGE